MAAVDPSIYNQMVTAWAVPCLAMFMVRVIELGHLTVVSGCVACLAVGSLLNRKRLDAMCWRYYAGEDSEELLEFRARMQGSRLALFELPCAVGFCGLAVVGSSHGAAGTASS
jgi:hypothetical protein